MKSKEYYISLILSHAGELKSILLRNGKSIRILLSARTWKGKALDYYKNQKSYILLNINKF